MPKCRNFVKSGHTGGEQRTNERSNENILKTIRDRIREDYRSDYVERMTNDPIDWLEEFGYYSRKTGLDKDAIKRGIVGVDRDELIMDLCLFYRFLHL